MLNRSLRSHFWLATRILVSLSLFLQSAVGVTMAKAAPATSASSAKEQDASTAAITEVVENASQGGPDVQALPVPPGPFLPATALPPKRLMGALSVYRDAAEVGIFYPDFSTTEGLSLVEEAVQVDDALRLASFTPQYHRGAAWYMVKQNVQDGFETIFQFRLNDYTGDGGDGLAFVIQNQSETAIGNAGCSMGYDGMSNSLAVEFDTFVNNYHCAEVMDPPGDHISIRPDGNVEHTDPYSYVVNLEDGDVHTAKITYQPGSMQVYFDDMTTPVLESAVDLAATPGLLDQGRAWVGFVAATGTSTEDHDILNWEFTSSEVIPTEMATFTISPETLIADDQQTTMITVTLRDNQDQLLAGHRVRLKVMGGGITVASTNPATTDANGQAIYTLKAKKSGVKTLGAADLTTFSRIGGSATVTFLPGPASATRSSLSASPGQLGADGISAATIKVIARDAFDNLIPGATVELFADQNAVVTQPAAPTDAAGTASGTVVDSLPEIVNLTAAINGQMINATAAVQFRAGDLSVTQNALALTNHGFSNYGALSGFPITYTIALRNTGLVGVNGVIVTDTLPAPLTFTTAMLNGVPASPVVNGNQLTWSLPGLAVGATTRLQVSAQIAPDFTGSMVNTVEATTTNLEEDTANNFSQKETLVDVPRPILTVSPLGPSLTIEQGGDGQAVITIRNTGLAAMSGLTVTPPPTFPWISLDVDGMADALSPGQSTTFLIDVSVPPDLTPGYYRDVIVANNAEVQQRWLGLTVHVTAPRRAFQVQVQNDQGSAVPGAWVDLVKQDRYVVNTQGSVYEYNLTASSRADGNGNAAFGNTEIGVYNYYVSAPYHDSTSGQLTVLEDEDEQTFTVILTARPTLALSPATPVIRVLPGKNAAKDLTIRNNGAAPLTNILITIPESIPWVYLGIPTSIPSLGPGQTLSFSVFASPPADQSGDVFQDYITVSADGGLTAQAALTVQLAPTVTRDLDLHVVDVNGRLVRGGSVTLIRQDLSVLIRQGVSIPYNEQYSQAIGSDGVAHFTGLPLSDYNYLASVSGYEPGTGAFVVEAQSPSGPAVQVVRANVRPDPFRVEFSVTPIDQGYDIELKMTYDTHSSQPGLLIPPRYWSFDTCDSSPVADTITVYNPTDLPIELHDFTLSVPGVSVEIGAHATTLPPRGSLDIPVTATRIGDVGRGVVSAPFTYQAADDPYVTFTFNPSSQTEELLLGQIYTATYTLAPGIFTKETVYDVQIGEPSTLDWISLSALAGPSAWQANTQVTTTLMVETPDELENGIYQDSIPVEVIGSNGTWRGGQLVVTITKTDLGMQLHTNFELGEIPTSPKEGLNMGYIEPSLHTCGGGGSGGGGNYASSGGWAWSWLSIGSGLVGHRISSSSSSIQPPAFPNYVPPLVYGNSHQQVRLSLNQRIMLEGEGFKANLSLDNISASALDDVSIDIQITDGDGNDRGEGFVITPTVMTGMGSIAAGQQKGQEWLLLPTGMAITDTAGLKLNVKAIIHYTWDGESYTFETLPEEITVLPSPDLHIRYELPLTEAMCDEWALTAFISNVGPGAARNVRFTSAQPRLTPGGTADLPIRFTIEGVFVDGEDAGQSLALTLGDIAPGETRQVTFMIKASQPGKFIEFTSDYRQSNYQGILLKPLITQIKTLLVPIRQCGGNIPVAANPIAGDNVSDSSTDSNWWQRNQVYVGGPVDVASGNYIYTFQGITMPGRGQSLDFRAIYSRDRLGWEEDNVLGPGWTHNFNIRLYIDKPAGVETFGEILNPQFFPFIAYQAANGSRLNFYGPHADLYALTKRCDQLDDDDKKLLYYETPARIADDAGKAGIMCPQPGNIARLTFRLASFDGSIPRFEYTLQLHDQTIYTFDDDGYLLRIDRTSNVTGGWLPLTLKYATPDPNQPGLKRLTCVYDGVVTSPENPYCRDVEENSRYIEFQYNSDGLISEIYDQRGGFEAEKPYLAFTYQEFSDEVDVLSSVVDLNGEAWEFAYDQSVKIKQALVIDYSSDPTMPAGKSDLPLDYREAVENARNREVGKPLLTSVSDPMGQVVERQTYNDKGCVTAQFNQDNQIARFDYPGGLNCEPVPEGHQVTVADGMNRSVTYQFSGSMLTKTTFPYWNGEALVQASTVQTGTVYTDANGNTVTESYEGVGIHQNQVGFMDAELRIALYAYDSYNNLTRSEDKYGVATVYTYSNSTFPTLLMAQADAMQQHTEYVYTSTGYLEQEIKKSAGPNGEDLVTFHVYVDEDDHDNFGQRTRTIENYHPVNDLSPLEITYDPARPDQNLTTDFRYDAVGRLTDQIDTFGRRTHIVYDNVGRVTRSIRNYINGFFDPNYPDQDVVTIFEYDPAGRLIHQWESVHATGDRLTTYTYYGTSRLDVSVTVNGEELVTHYDYDSAGNVIRVTDPSGRVQYTCYDLFRHPVRQIQNFQASAHPEYVNVCTLPRTDFSSDADKELVTDWVYDPAGNLIVTLDPLNHATHQCYDRSNRVINIIQNPVTQSNPKVLDTSLSLSNHKDLCGTLNPVHIPTKVSRPEGAPPDTHLVTNIVRDLMGNVTATTSPDGVTTVTCYDALYRPSLTVTNPTVASFADTVDTPEDKAHSNACQSYLNSASFGLPDQDVIIGTEYDHSGRVQRTTHWLSASEGRMTYFTYDAIGRLTKTVRNYHDGQYDDAHPDWDVSSEKHYTTTLPNGFRYQLEVVDQVDLWRPANDTGPSELRTRTIYDAVGRVSQTIFNYQDSPVDADTNLLTSYVYDGAGNVLKATDPLGRITVNTYDEANHLTRSILNCVSSSGTGSCDQPETIHRSSAHPDQNIITIKEYDGLGRLKQETGTLDRVKFYVYDGADRVIKVIQNYIPAINDGVFDPDNLELSDINVTEHYEYDKGGNRIATTDTMGRVDQICYDALNRPFRQVQNAKVASQTACSSGFRLPEGPADENVTTSFIYSATVGITETVNALGISTRFEYDRLNRRTKAIQNYRNGVHDVNDLPDQDVITQMVYDQVGNEVKRIDPFGETHTTVLCYDGLDRLTRQVVNVTGNNPCDPSGYSISPETDHDVITTFQYDTLGRVYEQIDPLGRHTRYSYDALGRVTQQIANYIDGDPGNGSNDEDVIQETDYIIDIHKTYHVITDSVRAREISQRVTRIEYDELGHQVTITYNYQLGAGYTPDVNVTTHFNYDDGGRIEAQIDPNGFKTSYEYDKLDRLTSVQVPVNNLQNQLQVSRTTYDGVGNVRVITDTLNHVTTFMYDAFNRQTSGTTQMNFVTGTKYNEMGNVVEKTDANQVRTRFEYDKLGRVVAVVENYTGASSGQWNNTATPDQNVKTGYTYDVLGNLTEATLPTGAIYKYSYDDLNRRTGVGLPWEANQWLWQNTHYDRGDRPDTIKESPTSGQRIQNLAYDDLDRLETHTYSGIGTSGQGVSVNYTYDGAANRLDTMADNWGTTTFGNDELDRLTSVTDPAGQTVSYAYDASGRRTLLGIPGKGSVQYVYDGPERLSSVVDWDAATADVQYGYKQNSNLLETISLPNGVTAHLIYDGDNRLTGIEYQNGAQTLMQVSYELDAVGNRTLARETLYTPPPDPVLFSDDGEYGENQWIVSNYWRLTTETAHSPTHSWSDSLNTNYGLGIEASLTLVIPLALPADQPAQLIFWDVTELGEGAHGYVEISTDYGQTWYELFHETNDTHTEWAQHFVNLAAYDGKRILVRFRLQTEYNAHPGDGWHVDDISIVANEATPTPTATATATATATSTPTQTLTPTLTNTPTLTATVTVTVTPTLTHTPTATLTATRTNTPTHTPTHTATATPTATRTETSSSTFTNTPTRTTTPTETPTQTRTPSDTPTHTATATLTRTTTPTETPTHTMTVTDILTNTPTNTATATETPTVTRTPSETTTHTATVTASPTHTVTATETQTPTETATRTVTVTDTPTNTATASETLTVTRTPSETPTDTATVTSSPTFTNTPTNTTTATQTATRTATPTHTPTSSATATLTEPPTSTNTETPTETPTHHTPTITATGTSTPTQTATWTATVTDTSTVTSSPTPTPTTVTVTPSATQTNTATATPTPPLRPLTLTGLCSPNPATELHWQVGNINPSPVNFTWLLITLSGNPSGAGVAPAANNGVPGTTTWSTTPGRWINIMVVMVNGQVQAISMANTTRCTAATATPPATATPMPPSSSHGSGHLLSLRPNPLPPQQNAALLAHDVDAPHADGAPIERTIAYTYDKLYRLTNAHYCDGGNWTYEECQSMLAERVYEYAYDLAGNRKAETVMLGTDVISSATFEYGLDNRLKTSSNSTTGETYEYIYDFYGNLTDAILDGSTHHYHYEYNAANQLVHYEQAITNRPVFTTDYSYNGLGDRYRQIANGVTTDYTFDTVSDLTQVLLETSNDQTTAYLPGLDVLGSQQNSTWRYFGYDGLGSVRQITDISGELKYAASYDPYGTPFEQIRASRGDVPALGFTGEETDPNGLLYLRARYYDPRLGVFGSRDPFEGALSEPATLNGYNYVGDNPVNYTDLGGNCWGPLEGLRDISLYNATCKNLDMAGEILRHPNATLGEKLLAVAYVSAEGVAHAALAVGGSILGANLIAPGAIPALEVGIADGQVLLGASMAAHEVTMAIASSPIIQGIGLALEGDQIYRALVLKDAGAAADWVNGAMFPTHFGLPASSPLLESIGKLSNQIINSFTRTGSSFQFQFDRVRYRFGNDLTRSTIEDKYVNEYIEAIRAEDGSIINIAGERLAELYVNRSRGVDRYTVKLGRWEQGNGAYLRDADAYGGITYSPPQRFYDTLSTELGGKAAADKWAMVVNQKFLSQRAAAGVSQFHFFDMNNEIGMIGERVPSRVKEYRVIANEIAPRYGYQSFLTESDAIFYRGTNETATLLSAPFGWSSTWANPIQGGFSRLARFLSSTSGFYRQNPVGVCPAQDAFSRHAPWIPGTGLSLRACSAGPEAP